MKMVWRGLVAALLALSPLTAHADVADELSKYVGYTVVSTKIIDRWVSSDGKQREDGFTRCDYGRAIIFTDGSYVECRSYGYQYAYRPKAVILSNGSDVVMIVRDRSYRIG